MRRLVLTLLFFTSLILLVCSNIPVDKNKVSESLERYLQNSYALDQSVITNFIEGDHDILQLAKLNNSPFFITIQKKDTIIFWTDKCEINDLSYAQNFRISQKNVDEYEINIFLNITNDDGYISDQILKDAHIHDKIKISKDTSQGYNISLSGAHFLVDVSTTGINTIAKAISWAILFFIFVSLSVWLLRHIQNTSSNDQKTGQSYVLLIGVVLGFKLLQFIPQWQKLFDGLTWFTILNDNSITTPTIVDLVTNLWVMGVVGHVIHLRFKRFANLARYKTAIAFISGLLTITLFGYSLHLIKGFLLNKNVNLEIESLLEFNDVSFILIICFSVLMILIFQVTQYCFKKLHQTSISPTSKYVYLSLGWATGLGILYGLNWLQVPIWIFTIFVIAYSLMLDVYVENKEQKITFLIWWLIVFSGFQAVSLFHFGLKKDIIARQRFIEEYFVSPDRDIITALSQMQDSLIQSGIFEKIAFEDKPANLNMHVLDKYISRQINYDSTNLERSIELFDKKGNTLFSHHFANFYKTNLTYTNAAKVGNNIYHNPFEDKYIIKLEIATSDISNTNRYLFIIHQHLNDKRNVFLNGQSLNHGFAVFNRGNLIEKNEGNQMLPDLQYLKNIKQSEHNDGYSYVVSEPSSFYKIVSFKKISGLIKPISLFSFIFTLSGLILLLLSLINTKFTILPESLSLKFGSRASLKTKIQLSIILLILVTFLVIGAITGFYFKNLIEVNQQNKNKEETNSIVNDILSDIQNLPTESVLPYLHTKLKEYSYVHDKELSVYDYTGSLIGTSIKGSKPLKIPYLLWYQTTKNDNKGAVSNFKGYDPSKTEYIPIFISDDAPAAFIGIAHRTYNNSSKSILDFLSTILNAYIFLFLIAGGIAITIANSITRPLSILAEKLKKFKLGKTNELLEWKSNDEIGTLIHDYNNLTQELERSAGLLAKTERDIAWREMAKQVAHEIKNPLTPMKLSIQYLEKTAKENPDRAQELIPRISSTLIEQIDNLSQIANEFSNFATMPQATNEKIILNEVVETIHDLFRKRDDMDINMSEPIDDLYVFADKNHLVRILNNLIKNAIQAIPENRRGKIDIELKRSENNALIRISDNGTGISDDMKDKVFTPNFTTKSSGTGLGLAISANMIESFNGKIYFETKYGKGTDFYISVPLMRLDDYISDSDDNRVSLD